MSVPRRSPAKGGRCTPSVRNTITDPKPALHTYDTRDYFSKELYSMTDTDSGSSNLHPAPSMPVYQDPNAIVSPGFQGGQGSQGSQITRNVYNTTNNTLAPQPVNRQYTINTIHFSSMDRTTANDEYPGRIAWNLQVINNNYNINNCTRIRLRSFMFPQIFTSAWPVATDYFYKLTAYMTINNLGITQAIKNSSQLTPHHFEFDVSNINAMAVRFTPKEAEYTFLPSIQTFDNLDVTFSVPNFGGSNRKDIPLPPDRVLVSIVPGTTPDVHFNIEGNTTARAFLDYVGVLDGTGTNPQPILVQFKNAVSDNSNFNVAVNSTNGLLVTEIIDDTEFVIAGLDAQFVATFTADYMYIPKNEFSMTIEFVSSVLSNVSDAVLTL